MMQQDWLVALDADGTVLTDDHRVPPEVAAAIQAARAAGARVVLATARAQRSAALVLAQTGPLDGLICFGGGQTFAEGADLAGPRVAPDLRRAVVARCREQGVALAVYGAEDVFVDRLNPLLEREFAATGLTGRETDLAALEAPVCKMLALVPGPDNRALHELRAEFGARLSCVFSHATLLEIMDSNVSKGLALAALRDAWGIAAARVVAIGDSENDLSMFRVAGLAIAMGNATPAVQRAAQRVTGDNNSGGVAEALRACVGLFGAGPAG